MSEQRDTCPFSEFLTQSRAKSGRAVARYTLYAYVFGEILVRLHDLWKPNLL